MGTEGASLQASSLNSKVVSPFGHLAHFILRSPVVAVSIAAYFLLFVFLHHNAADPDLFARMAVGKLVSETGKVTTLDPFAFTPKLPQWIDHEWLSGLCFYWLYQQGGAELLFWVKFLLAVFSIMALAAASRYGGLDKTNFTLAFLPLVLALSYVWRSTVRAQVFTYLFFPLIYLCIQRARQRKSKKELYFLPPIFLLWANFHGGFVLGLLVLGIFAVHEVLLRSPLSRAFMLCGLLSLLITLLNPYVFDYWIYLSNALTMPRPNISEWQSVSPLSPVGIMLIFCLLVSICGARAEIKRRLPELGCLLVFFVLAMLHLRLAAPFLMTVIICGGAGICFCAKSISSLLGRLVSPIEGGITLALLAAIAVAAFESGDLNKLESRTHFSLAAFPVGAVDYLLGSEHGGKLLVDFNNGSYALWRLYPKFTVSMDGRYEEVYPQSTVDLVRCAVDVSCPEMLAAIEQLHPDLILFTDQENAQKFESAISHHWRKVFEDEQSMVFVRS